MHFQITTNPTMLFVKQQTHRYPCGIMEFEWEFVHKIKDKIYMIHDGAGEFGFDLLDYGIKSVKASFKSPNLNSVAERFIGSVRREALDHFLLFNKKQVFGIIKKYIEYYNTKRPHQGIGGNIPGSYEVQKEGQIKSEKILFGLHHHYYRSEMPNWVEAA